MSITVTVTQLFYFLNLIMEYTIKELEKKWIPKRKIYQAVDLALPISYELIGNKRIFNDSDLEIFSYYINHWEKRTVEKFWTTKNLSKNNTVPNSNKPVPEPSPNSPEQLNKIIEKQLDERISTVTKQFDLEKTKLTEKITQQNRLIEIKDNKTQETAIQLRDEKKEKGEWINKYENLEKKHSNTKVFLAVSLVILLSVSWFLYLVMSNTIKFD